MNVIKNSLTILSYTILILPSAVDISAEAEVHLSLLSMLHPFLLMVVVGEFNSVWRVYFVVAGPQNSASGH